MTRLTTFPILWCRSAGGLSSRLGCQFLNAAPWAARQQMRFASSDNDDYKADHFGILGLKPPVTIAEIEKARSRRLFETHPDHNKDIKDNSENIKVQDAGRILKDPVKRAKCEAFYWSQQESARPAAEARQQASDAPKAGVDIKNALRRSQQARRDEKHAKVVSQKREQAKRAQELADMVAREKKKLAGRYEELLRKAWEGDGRTANKPKKGPARPTAAKRPPLNSSRAPEAKVPKYNAAKRAAEAAKKAELAREGQKTARLAVVRAIPYFTQLAHVFEPLFKLKPGRILHSCLEDGTARVEFFTAEEAQVFYRFVTETGQYVVRGKNIKAAAMYAGQFEPPQGPEFISRSIRIFVPSAASEGQTALHTAVESILHKLGFEARFVSYKEKVVPTGRYLALDYASVEDAKNAKAVLEKHYPNLEVSFHTDPYARSWGTETGKDSTKDKSGDFFSMLISVLLL